MIYCLLIETSLNRQGVSVRKESIIAGESIKVGRSTSCKLRLLDQEVALHHATLKRTREGALYIEAEGDATIKVNDVASQNAHLTAGTRVEIGPYLLIVDPATTDSSLALTVEMMRPPAGRDEAKREPLTLEALRMSKRRLGLGLVVGLLFFFLLLPLLPSLSPELDKIQAQLPITLTDSWNPGPLSSGHRAFGEQCSACHKNAFRGVPDDACVACHKKTGNHLANDALHGALFKDMRCTECHIDHKGKSGLMPYDSARCVACHSDIKAKSARSTVGNVHAFTKDHPQFRITLPSRLEGQPAMRMLQTPKLQDDPGLKFSHKVHLDKDGISTPQGDTVMSCPDCHQSDEAGIHFEPIDMKKSCQQSGCHALDFTEPVEGAVPHGSVREVMSRMRSYYAHWLAQSPENMAECTHDAAQASALQGTFACASDLAQKNAAEYLFSKDAGCAECHEISATGDNVEPWKVKPVRINRNWHSKAVFVHAKHDTTECTSCHDKSNSKNSADISMPKIEKCRECHVDDKPVKGKVSNTCYSCHQFHGGGDAAK